MAEHADGVGAAAHAGHHVIGKFTLPFQHLGAGFAADDALEMGHQMREGMRPGGRSEAVVGVGLMGYPVAQGFVDGVFEGLGPVRDRRYFRAQYAHALHVGPLAFHVDGAHEDFGFKAQTGGGRRRGHAVLARAGLGDEAGFAHFLGEQGLAQGVVDLVGAGVQQILAFEIER